MRRQFRTSFLNCSGAAMLVGATAILSGQISLQQPARDSRVEPTLGTASLSGTLVTDDSSSQPIRRARVAVSTADGQAVQTVFTDEAGRFSATKLAPGRYLVVTTRPSYVRTAFGAKRFDRPGTPITLVEGQQLANLVIRMARGAVIAGTIADDQGQPMAGVNVQVLQYRMQGGERTLSPAVLAGGSLNEVTDDRGAYRIYGLPAGDYVVSATPRTLGNGDVRQTTAADIQSVQRALQQPPPAPGTTRPPVRQPDAVMVGYSPVYYPGTTTPASATTVTVGAGEERTGVDFGLQLVRTARIDGVVIVPDGVSPQSVQLLMLPSGSGGLPMRISIGRVAPGPEGKFSYTGVTPGQYSITARATRAGSPAASLWALADVNVEGQDLSGVTLALQPGMTVSGRIAVQAVGADAPADFSRARVTLAPAGPSNGITLGVPSAQVDATGRFTMQGVTPGRYRLSAILNSPEATWTLKAASAKSREALDSPIDVLPNENISDAVLTFTNQTQDVSGTLQDASGRPAPDFTIVVFPADKLYWTAARRIRTTRPATDGRFVLKNLPAGDYRIAALVDMAPTDANDPLFLEQLVTSSVAFTLRDGETKVQDLRIR